MDNPVLQVPRRPAFAPIQLGQAPFGKKCPMGSRLRRSFITGAHGSYVYRAISRGLYAKLAITTAN